MTPVTLYSQPGCGPCVAVKSHLARAGVAVTVRDVTVDPAAAETVRALGYTGTPVVVAGDMHTHGYRRDWLNNLVAAIRAEEADQDGHVDGLLAAVEVAA